METLYILVGMFPNNDKMDNKGELVDESSESKPSTLPEARESPAPTLGLFLICYYCLVEALLWLYLLFIIFFYFLGSGLLRFNSLSDSAVSYYQRHTVKDSTKMVYIFSLNGLSHFIFFLVIA